MRRSWAAFTVGALTLVVVGIGYGLFRYTSEKMGGHEGYVVFALFRDALGLTAKSRVLSAGITVGEIEGRFLDQESGKAKVTIRMKPEITIYENAMVSKKSASLLGEFYLDVDPGTPFGMKDGQRVTMRKLKDGDRIMNVFEQVGTADIMNEVGSTLPILKEILLDVRSLTSGQVKDIATNVNEMIEKNSVTLERLLNRMDNIAASIEGITREESDDIKISLQNIREITEGVKGLVGTSEGTVNTTGQELRSSLQKLQKSVDSLERSLTNTEKITGKIAGGEGTVGKLINDPAIAENVEQITEDAGDFVRGVTRLQTIVGLRTEYNYLANTFKTYFQVQLAPRPDKFYLIEIVDDPRGFREQTTEFVDSSERGTFSETRVKLSEKLRISFMFGKRWGPITGTFGIKESTGGVGLAVHLLDDRLTLSTDIFDTRSNQYPRVQGRATLAVYKKYFHLIAGLDDAFNLTRNRGGGGGFFDWFFGAQLQFNDEDLKSLLLFGGSAVSGAASK
jgi:phospholipid/cholesterol/gamma-HCH transport system substrate-binding protein